MGREKFRSTYEVTVGGKVPTLFSIRTRIERENGRESVRGTKRGRGDMTTTQSFLRFSFVNSATVLCRHPRFRNVPARLVPVFRAC